MTLALQIVAIAGALPGEAVHRIEALLQYETAVGELPQDIAAGGIEFEFQAIIVGKV